MISENQDGKTEPASQATGWDSGLGHPLRLDRCPSLAGAGEGGRRPGEGREGYSFFCGKDRGENSPNDSRFEPLNRSSRREEALTVFQRKETEPPHVGCYEVHGEVSSLGSHKTVARRGHELPHPASLSAMLETQNIVAGEANSTLIPRNAELLGQMVAATQGAKAGKVI